MTMTKNKSLRMDDVLLVVDDLGAAKAFFFELGREGETTIEGPLVDRLIDLQKVRATLALKRTADATGGSSWPSSIRRKRSEPGSGTPQSRHSGSAASSSP